MRLLLADLVVEMMESKNADGMSPYTYMNQRSFFRMLSKEFPKAKLSDLTTPVLDDWLRAKAATGVSGRTRNSYRIKVHGLFTYAKSRRYCIDNPAVGTVKAKENEKEPGILTVGESARLLEVCHQEDDPIMLVCVALGLFAGLRPLAEVARLDWRHLNFTTNLIDIAADRTKAFKGRPAQRRFVEMHPNLVEWLLPYRKPYGKVGYSPNHYAAELRFLRAKAGITVWDNDTLRHTFASMHYGHFNDAGKTCKEMGHTGFNILFKHYRARVDPSEAAAFWNIRPGRESNVVPMLATA